MSLFERWLTLWVALCILAGLVLGNLLPGVFAALAALEYASVNLVVAVLIWAMVYPMMIAIDFGSLKAVGQRPKGLVITLVINWLIKPFTMAALAVLFFDHLFAGLIDPDQRAGIHRRADPAGGRALHGDGVRLVADDQGRSELHAGAGLGERSDHGGGLRADRGLPAGRHRHRRAVGDADPVGRALRRDPADRRGADATGADRAGRRRLRSTAFTARIKPASVLGLLLTVVLLFGFQGPVILAQPLLIALIAVPIIIQSYGIFALGYGWAYLWRVPHKIAAPCALIGTSNFFELAVAVAIGLFGLNSGAALATVVGVLVEVPVMLSASSPLPTGHARGFPNDPFPRCHPPQPRLRHLAQCAGDHPGGGL